MAKVLAARRAVGPLTPASEHVAEHVAEDIIEDVMHVAETIQRTHSAFIRSRPQPSKRS